jgi:hypothetical protein
MNPTHMVNRHGSIRSWSQFEMSFEKVAVPEHGTVVTTVSATFIKQTTFCAGDIDEDQVALVARMSNLALY